MELESTAARLGIQVLREKLFGTRSGLCRVHDQYLLFIERRLKTEEQIEVLIVALSRFPLENLPLLPRVRELLEQYRAEEGAGEKSRLEVKHGLRGEHVRTIREETR